MVLKIEEDLYNDFFTTCYTISFSQNDKNLKYR